MSVPTTRPPNFGLNSRPIYDMDMPFDPNRLIASARAQGLPLLDAQMFAHLALQELRNVHRTRGPDAPPVTKEEMAEAIQRRAALHVQRASRSTAEIAAAGVTIADDMELEIMRQSALLRRPKGEDHVAMEMNTTDGMPTKRYKFSIEGLKNHFGGKNPYSLEDNVGALSLKHTRTDLISAICQYTELAVELGKHLRPEDIVNLYRASRGFHDAVNGHMLSSVRTWIAHRAPEAGRIFDFRLYRRQLVYDPAGRPDDYPFKKMAPGSVNGHKTNMRIIPGLKYLQLVLGRARYCREMIAILARNGHRVPPTMHSTLLRLWLLMEVSTTSQRLAMLRNENLWRETDLYNAQFLFIKLSMHFNDPLYGPTSNELLHLMLGQKGLYPLWQLLMRKRYNKLSDFMKLKVRYDVQLPPDHYGADYFTSGFHGVPFEEIGIGHCEGWGLGRLHLMRPDELVPIEAVARGLALDKHLSYMMIWGYIDFATGENLVPTEEEMYISDEEKTLARVDTRYHWNETHCRKKRWQTLSSDEQQEILDDDEDERLRAMGWSNYTGEEDEDGFFYDDASDSDSDYSSNLSGYDSQDGTDSRPPPAGRSFLDDEIRRGYRTRRQPKDKPSEVPPADDKEAWKRFVDKTLLDLPPQVTQDQLLRAQSLNSYYGILPNEGRQEFYDGDDEDEFDEDMDMGNGDDADADVNEEEEEEEEEDEDEEEEVYDDGSFNEE